MQLALTTEEAAFRDELRSFYTTEIPEELREAVRQGAPVTKDQIVTSQKILNDHGLAVPNWPVEWGGKDWTPTQHQIWADEMQLACVPEPLNFNAKMVGPVIAEFGSQEIKQRFLPPTASLDIWWCQGFSEPEAGSDLASLRTTALRDGDSYVVASGWGPTAEWYRNILHAPNVTIQLGTQTIPVTAIPLDKEEGAEVFVRYGSHHRAAAKYMLPRVL